MMRTWAVAAWALLFVASCLSYGIFDETGNSGASKSASSNMGGSAGPGQGPGSGAGGSTGGCDMPCGLVAQCGCADQQKCTLFGGAIACQPDGDAQAGELCVFGECEAGSICDPANADAGTCKPFCNNHDDCNGGPTGGDGSSCIIELLGSNDETLGFACSVDCDPIENDGCVGPETGCRIRAGREMGEFATDCSPAGLLGHASPCNDVTDCRGGMVCVDFPNLGFTCLKICDIDSPACPGGAQNCQPFMSNISIGDTNYGACLPP